MTVTLTARSLAIRLQHPDAPARPFRVLGFLGGGEGPEVQGAGFNTQGCVAFSVSCQYETYILEFLNCRRPYFLKNHLLFHMGRLPGFPLNMDFPQKLA